MEWKQIEEVNKKLAKINIKGKKYTMVKDKVLGLRAIEPNATIDTEVLHFDGKSVIIKAIVVIDGVQIGSGIAEEKADSTTINKTSFVENCETSAIGRALSSMGIGAEDSYASGEEVAIAMINQSKPKAKLDDYTFEEKLAGVKSLFKKMGDFQQSFLDGIKSDFNYNSIDDIKEDDIDAIGKIARNIVKEIE